MRAALVLPFLLPLLLLTPSVIAAPVVYEHSYVVWGSGCAGGGALVRNCERYFPSYGQTTVKAEVTDVSGQNVRITICHEWTYDNGSHPTVWCKSGCSPSLTDTLAFPGARTTYRVTVDLRGQGACPAAATAGTLRTTFS